MCGTYYLTSKTLVLMTGGIYYLTSKRRMLLEEVGSGFVPEH